MPIPEYPKMCYTDLANKLVPDHYTLRSFKLDQYDPRRRNRRVKIYWLDIFRKYDYSIYLDCRCELRRHPEELISLMGKSDILVESLEAERDCLYQEAEEALGRHGHVDRDKMRKQIGHYRREGYPEHNGLYVCYFILRRHTEQMRQFSKKWWGEVRDYTCRDQVSFPYVVWKTGISVVTVPKDGHTAYRVPTDAKQRAIRQAEESAERLRQARRYERTPSSPERRVGRASLGNHPSGRGRRKPARTS